MPADSTLAHHHGAVSRRRLDHGFQCRLLVLRCLGCSRMEVRRLEPWFSDIRRFGYFRFRRIVFCSDACVRRNGKRAGWASGVILDVDFQPDPRRAR